MAPDLTPPPTSRSVQASTEVGTPRTVTLVVDRRADASTRSAAATGARHDLRWIPPSCVRIGGKSP